MQRLFKRTLAFMLVVCLLMGMMVLPTFATDEETPAKTFTYDFTQMSNTTGTENKTSEDVFWGSSTAQYFGYGNINLFGLSAHQSTVLNKFYNDGNFTWSCKLSGEAEATKYSVDIPLNWMPLAVENQTYTKADGTTTTLSGLIVGGRNYNDSTKQGQYVNGLNYTPKRYDADTAKVIQSLGWVALKIKAPEIGTYSVALDYSKSQYGAKEGVVYVLPGVLTEAEIEEAIENGTGKLKNTVDFLGKRADILASDTAIYALPIAYNDSGVVSSNVSQPGYNTVLGNVEISEPVDEYTVIFQATVDRNGTTDGQQAYMHLDGLTFTEVGERPSASGTTKVYNFDRGSNGVFTVEQMKALSTTGTADSSTGGYPILTANTTGVTVTSTDKLDAEGQPITQSGKTVYANYHLLRYYNGWTTSTSTLGNVYFAKELDTSAKTATIDKTGVGITNYNLKNLLESKYDQLGWKILGSTSGSTGSYFALNQGYLYTYNITRTTGRPAGNYMAIQIKSPGEGEFKVDLDLYHMNNSNAVEQRHMGLNVYIVRKSDESITITNDYVVTYKAMTDYDAYYNPDYSMNSAEGQTVRAELVDATDGGSFTYEFEADTEYIVYLQHRYADAEGNQVTYTTSSGTDVNGDGVKYYSPNNIYIKSMTCTPVVDTVATIGEDFTPAADAEYSIGRAEMADEIVKLYDTTAVLTDETLEASTLASGNAFYYRSASAGKLTVSALPNGVYAYHKTLMDLHHQLYADGVTNWKVLDFVARGGDIRFDNGALVAYTMKAGTTDGTCNSLAFVIRSPGEGNYQMSFNLSNQAAVATKTVNGVKNTYETKSCHLWMNAYLVKIDGANVTEDNFKTVQPATPLGEIVQEYFHEDTTSSIGSVVPLTVKGSEVSTPVNFHFEKDAQYILYLEGHEEADTQLDVDVYETEGAKDTYSSAGLYLKGIEFECMDVATEKVEYSTLTEALATAKPGETVTLQKNATINNIVIRDDVTLDLNGHTVSAQGFATSLNGEEVGAITDSSNGAGALKVLRSNASFLGDGALSGNVVPMYDAANSSYKFYKYSYNGWGAEDDTLSEGGVDGAIRFWYQLQFTNKDAYTLLASSTTGVYMGAEFAYDGNNESRLFANSTEASVTNDAEAWAAAYGAYAGGLAEGKSPWLWVRVLNAADADSLTVTPYITAGGVEIALAPMTYNVVAD